MPGGALVVTCHQPTYLPWAGLFHKIALADRFVVMDTVDYSHRNWLNRNRLKGPHGGFWLTVPVSPRTSPSRRIVDIAIAQGSADWQRAHWRSLHSAYARAPFWGRYSKVFEELYLGRTWTGLAEFNLVLLRTLAGLLEIGTEFVPASALGWSGRKSRLILDHCRRSDADVYISGMNGHDYLLEDEFIRAGISIVYQRYRGPVYPQRNGGFVPDLSVVDLLFNVGPHSADVLRDGNVTRKELDGLLARTKTPFVAESPAAAAGAGPRLIVRAPSAVAPSDRLRPLVPEEVSNRCPHPSCP